MKTNRSVLIACILLTVAAPAAAGEPVVVVPAVELADVRQPQLASDGGKHLYVTYGSKNAVYCSVSTDAGRSFGSPVLVGKVKHLSLGMRRGPRVAVSGQNVVISAIGGDLGGGKDGDLLAWHSADHGKSWHGPVRVNDVAGSSREGLHAMAGGPGGRMYAVWLDLRFKGTKIFGSLSRDGGSTWDKNTLVYQSPSGSVCECCHPSVVFGKSGALHVMWRNSVDGNRDLYHTVSTDDGQSFSHAERLGTESWPLDACPMDGGGLAALSDGQVVTAWRRDKDVYYTHGRRETRLGQGEQPWVASDGARVYFAWLSRRPGDLLLASTELNQPLKVASGAIDPVVIAHGPHVIAFWESRAGDKSTIYAAQVPAGR